MLGDFVIDERGKVTFVNDFKFEGVKRFYVVENHRPSFRGWHGHEKEAKYIFCISGAAVVGFVPLGTNQIKRYTLSVDKPKVLYIPPGHANGFRTLTKDTKLVFFSTATLEESKNDDIRFPEGRWPL